MEPPRLFPEQGGARRFSDVEVAVNPRSHSSTPSEVPCSDGRAFQKDNHLSGTLIRPSQSSGQTEATLSKRHATSRLDGWYLKDSAR